MYAVPCVAMATLRMHHRLLSSSATPSLRRRRRRSRNMSTKRGVSHAPPHASSQPHMHSNLPSLSRMAIATHTPPPLARVGGVGLVGAVEADALLSMLAVEGLSIDAPGDSRASKVRGGHFGERADSAQMAVRLLQKDF